MSEAPLGEFKDLPNENASYFLRDIHSDIISVEVPSDKPSVETSKTSTDSPYRVPMDKRATLAVTQKLFPKTIIEIADRPERPRYFEVGEPIAQKDKERYPNSVWLEPLPNMNEDELYLLKMSGRPIYTIDNLPLTKEVKEKISPLLKNPREAKIAA